MVFKKLHPYIKEKLTDLEITTPTPFQIKSIPLIKSGANVYCFAPNNSGKTTTLVITTLHALKCEEAGSAPRAIILVEDNTRALELNEIFINYTKQSTLRVYMADERAHIDLLKSEIYEGVDILIGTPKTVNKLLLLEGLNTRELKIFSIDDAAFLTDTKAYAAVMAITQSIHKCQFVLYTDKMLPLLKRFEDYFMKFAKIAKI